MATGCADCGREYGSAGFPDMIIPDDDWLRIAPQEDGGGLLCPSCMIARIAIEGIECPAAFMNGPVESVDRTTMRSLRLAEMAWGKVRPRYGEGG